MKVDLVTAWDVKVEDLVKKQISEAYPNFKLCVTHIKEFSTLIEPNSRLSIGEETFAAGGKDALTEDPTFCVDPIGTFTFLKHMHTKNAEHL